MIKEYRRKIILREQQDNRGEQQDNRGEEQDNIGEKQDNNGGKQAMEEKLNTSFD